MWPVGFSIKWKVSAGCDPLVPIYWDKIAHCKRKKEKEMKRENQYKLNKAMALPLA